MNAEIPFTVVLDDPLANSYIQNPFAPDDDPQMTTEHYERTFEQNDELGRKEEARQAAEDADAKAA
jgi:zinc finger protein